MHKWSPNLVAKILATKFGFVPDWLVMAQSLPTALEPVTNISLSDECFVDIIVWLTAGVQKLGQGSKKGNILNIHSISTLARFEMNLMHYSDVIMSTVSSKITGVTIVYSTVCSGADQRKHQSYASLAFVRGIPPNCRTPPSLSANQIRKLKCGKANGEALDHGNYRGLKLTDQVMKLLERVLNSSNCQMLNMDEMQFTFVPGRSTTDAIFIVGGQQMYITAANKKLQFAFVDFEKAFDCVPRRSCGGPWGAWVWMNWLRMSSRACTPMPGAVCGLMVNTVKSLGWEFLCIGAPSLAHCSPSWCWKHYHISSALVCHGSFSMLMTACSSQTPRRNISPSSRYGRLEWKVKGSVSTWRRPSSWSLVLALMSK